MSQRELCIIFNPAAKGERAGRFVQAIRERFPGAYFQETRHPGHATELARLAAAEFPLVVAAGGDGTINEVVNGLAGSETVLGVLPIGSVNVFAMELGIPGSLRRALEVLRDGVVRKIDLPQANDRYFVQLAGVGLDAETVRTTLPENKKAYGPLSYVMSLATLAGKTAPTLNVKNGTEKAYEASFMLVGNGRHYGGPFSFFPGAELTDGQLDVCLFHKCSHFDLLRYFRGILTYGAHTGFPDVTYFKADQLTVEAAQEVPFEVDGEFHGCCPVTFRVRPVALRVKVPSPGS